jgi:hypothetical protein
MNKGQKIKGKEKINLKRKKGKRASWQQGRKKDGAGRGRGTIAKSAELVI